LARQISDNTVAAIEQVLQGSPEGVSAQQILLALPPPAVPLRTLQYRLQQLVMQGRLIMRGGGRGARYQLHALPHAPDGLAIPLSPVSSAIRNHVRQPTGARKPVGYERRFLDAYRPNVSGYLSAVERAHLAAVGQLQFAGQPAGTHARQILNRLLVDLAWNSSRLEGNTYSLLDTRRLIELGEEAEGRAHIEAQMILNHKDAIEFLVSAANETGFNRYTILNLHALLANNLLADAMAAGRLRHIAVGIEQSTFHPLEVPQLIGEAFDQILATAAAITDPFEQALFIMVQLPYLQPFDDVNKRVSRLAANIPFIKNNLSPLSFADVPQQTYTEAVLGVYELNQVDLLKEVFIWAYERSAARYAAVRQSLGEPDPFRLRFRVQLREAIADLVRSLVRREEAVDRIAAWSKERIDPASRDQFNAVVESELMCLHEGNFARYQIRPSEFTVWRDVWG
jgi:hypothetical protein